MRTVFHSSITWRKEEPSMRILYGVIGVFKGRNCKKRPQIKKKIVLIHQENPPCQKSVAVMAKLHLELHPYPPYFLDLVPSDYCLFAGLKRILQGKRFGSNEEVIAETKVYFEVKDMSFYKKGIEMLEKR